MSFFLLSLVNHMVLTIFGDLVCCGTPDPPLSNGVVFRHDWGSLWWNGRGEIEYLLRIHYSALGVCC